MESDKDKKSSSNCEQSNTCRQCRKAFACSDDLIRHTLLGTCSRPSYQCMQCGSKFMQQSQLAVHILTHSDVLICSCPHCDEQCSSLSELAVHIRTHSTEDVYACQFCGKQLSEAAEFLEHLRTHSGDKPFTCIQCNRKFPSSDSLAAHVKIHTCERAFKCQFCDKSFAQSSVLKGHLRTHTGERPYVCQQCGKGFTKSFSLSRHMQIHKRSSNGTSCSHCGKETCRCEESGKLSSIDNRLSCEQCSAEFEHPDDLNLHMSSMHGGITPTSTDNELHPLDPRREDFLLGNGDSVDDASGRDVLPNSAHCDDTGQYSQVNVGQDTICSSPKLATEHRRRVKHRLRSANPQPLECTHCNKKFKWSSHLADHIRTHTGEKPYKCHMCEKSFAQSGVLSAHIRTHTGERPHMCRYCERRFTRQSDLAVHIRTHTGEKKHVCPHCEKAFAQSNILKAHIRTHTGERPYKCGHCGKGYARSNSLSRHVRSHLVSNSSSCGDCRENPCVCSEASASLGISNTADFQQLLSDKADSELNRSVDVECKTLGTASIKREPCNETDQHRLSSVNHNVHDDAMLSTAVTITGATGIAGSKNIRQFDCPYCEKKYKANSDLTKHIRTHTGEKPYKCHLCDKAFNQSSVLADHIRIHTGDRPFKCLQCGSRFKKRNHLTKHKLTHRVKTGSVNAGGTTKQNAETVVNSTVAVLGQQPADLLIKSEPFDELEEPLPYGKVDDCVSADFLINSENFGAVDDSNCHYENCQESDSSVFAGSVDMGLDARKDSGKKVLSCPFCDKTFKRNEHLANHVRVHTGERPFRCHICDRTFAHSSGLVTHVRIHTGDRPYVCRLCGKAFTKSGHLLRHTRSHASSKRLSRFHKVGDDAAEIESANDSAVSPQKSNESEVSRQPVLGNGSSNLPQNSAEFHSSDSSSLFNTSKTDGSSFRCCHCGKTFATSAILLDHMKTHPGAEYHPCQSCGRVFPRISNLLQHMKVHSGKKPFICGQCGRRFTWKSSLSDHLTVHSGLKPYACSFCGKAFARRSYLREHVKIHTASGEIDECCQRCGEAVCCCLGDSQLEQANGGDKFGEEVAAGIDDLAQILSDREDCSIDESNDSLEELNSPAACKLDENSICEDRCAIQPLGVAVSCNAQFNKNQLSPGREPVEST